jgi:hypothetical protein
MADVQIAVIDQQNTEVTIAVPGAQGPVGQTGDVAVAQDGTAAQPGIRFENDTNTGIYRPGSDQVAVSTGGTGRLFVDASGNVQIGSSFAGLSNGSGLEIERSTTSAIRLTGADGVGCEFFNTGSLASIQTRSTIPFTIQTNELERMRVTAAGLVGIGTSTPGQKLDVNGEIVCSPNTAGKNTFQLTTNASDDARLLLRSDTTVKVEIQANGTSYFNGGNVGIGVSAPAAALDVRATSFTPTNTGSALLLEERTTNSQALHFYLNNAGVNLSSRPSGGIGAVNSDQLRIAGGGIITGNFTPSVTNFTPSATAAGAISVGGNIQFFTKGSLTAGTDTDLASSERMTITSSGNVGIGTTSPNTPFVVSASGTAGMEITPGSGGASGGTLIEHYNRNTAAYTLVRTLASAHCFDIGSSEAVRIDTSGRLLVGTSTAQTNASEISTIDGNIALVNDDTYSTSLTRALTYYSSTSSYDVQPIASINFNTTGDAQSSITFVTRSSPGDFAERARIDSSGRLLVGTTSARSGGPYGTAGLQVESTSYSNASISAINNQNTSDGVALMLGKSRGSSIGSTTIVSSGDQVGGIYFQGADGSALRTAASIFAEIDGTPGANDMPGRLVFSTTADGASSPTEACRITSNQDLLLSQSGSGIFVGTTVDGAFRIGRSSFAVSTGTLYIGNAAIQVSSDIRLKDNIEDTSLDALEAISKIKVKDFTWSDPSDTSYNNRNARGKWTGLIAQELVDVLPFVVNAPRKEEDGSIDHDSDSIWTLDQSQLCPVLIKAVQQQQEIITALEARLTAAGL